MTRPQAALALTALAAALIPRRDVDRLPTVCPFRLVTGYPCPTCGMTRSWHSLARLDPMRAVRDHPLGPAILGVVVTGAFSPGTVDRFAGRVPTRAKALALVAWLGWWASRLIATRRSRAA